MDRKQSSYSTVIPDDGDFVIGLQKQTNGSYKNAKFSLTGQRLLGKIIGFDMNSTNDQLITLSGGTKFIVTDIVITNATINLNMADYLTFTTQVNQGGVYIADTKSLQPLGLAPMEGLSILTNPNKYINSIGQNNTNALYENPYINIYNKQDAVGTSIYALLGTAQGALATADIYIYGYPF